MLGACYQGLVAHFVYPVIYIYLLPLMSDHWNTYALQPETQLKELHGLKESSYAYWRMQPERCLTHRTSQKICEVIIIQMESKLRQSAASPRHQT